MARPLICFFGSLALLSGCIGSQISDAPSQAPDAIEQQPEEDAAQPPAADAGRQPEPDVSQPMAADAGQQPAQDAATPMAADAGPSHEPSPAETAPPNVPTVGMSPSCDQAQCETAARGIAEQLSSPAASPYTFVDGHCGMVSTGLGTGGVTEGMACDCDTGSGSIYIGPKGAGCYALGRAGSCLWDDEEYEACSPQADTCPALCKELERRYAADAKQMFDATVRYAHCSEQGWCHHVLRIGDACYADHSYDTGRAFDCALSDSEIIAKDMEAQRTPPPPDCNDPSVRMNGGICLSPEPPLSECVKRPAGEWQGVLVCPPYALCEVSSRCGGARACIDGLCRACTRDDQCGAGEGCALDHCLPSENIECHTRSDCASGAMCILSGITGGTARGNEDMRAYCLQPDGGA